MPHRRRWVVLLVLVLALTAALAPPAGAVPSSTPDVSIGADGPVLSLTRQGDRVYLGGIFTKVGSVSGGGAPIDLGTNVTSIPADKIDGDVYAVAADGSGGWYVGGFFAHVGATPRENLAHILPNGAVDPGFNPSVDDEVDAIVVAGSKVYAGGEFSIVNVGQPTIAARDGLAAFNASNGIVDPFDARLDGGGGGPRVYALAFSGGKLYAGGLFDTANDGLGTMATRNNLAAFDTGGTVDPTFDPDVDNRVDTLAVSGSTVYAGGDFNTVNQGGAALSRFFLAKFAASTGVVDPTFDPAPSGFVSDLVLSGPRLYVTGGFAVMNDGQASQATRRFVAAVSPTTGEVDPVFDPSVQGCICAGVDTIAVSGSKVYVGGGIQVANFGQPTETLRDNVAAFDATTGVVDTAFDPSPDGPVVTLEIAGGKLFAGGEMTLMGTTFHRQNLAAISATTGAVDPAFDPRPDDAVVALTASAGRLYAGGFFTEVNVGAPTQVTRNHLAAFDLATGVPDAGFDPDVRFGCACGAVGSLLLNGSKLYLGGDFDTVNAGAPTAATRNNVAAVNASTGEVDASFDPDANATVAALGLAGSKLYLGGAFQEVNSGTTPVARSTLAAVNATTGVADPSFDPNTGLPPASPVVTALALSGSKVYAAGVFNTVNVGTATETTRHKVAAFDATSGVVDAGFDPDLGTNSLASSLAADGSTIYVGGVFTSVNQGTPSQVARQNLAAFDATSGVVEPTFAPDPDGPSLALLTDGGKLYTAGAFFGFGNRVQPFFARFSPPPTPPGPPAPPTPDPPAPPPPIQPVIPKPFLRVLTLKVSSKTVSALSACGGARCTGTASLKTVNPYRKGSSKKKAKVSLSSNKFTIGAGSSKTIKIRLSKADRAFLAKYKSVAVRLTVTLDSPNTVVTRRLMVFRTATKKKATKK
jgi:hypothetical protein